MSTFRPPSERRSTFNPVFYTSDSSESGGVTFDDLDEKLSRVGGTMVNGTLQNANFTGGQIETRLQAQDLTAVVKRNESKKYFDAWHSSTVCYYDFSDPKNLGQDVTSHGCQASVRGPITYEVDAIRTNAIKFPLNLTEPQAALTTPCLALDAHASVLKTASYSVSMWVKLDPVTTGSTQRFVLYSMTKVGALGSSILNTDAALFCEANGNLTYRTKLDGGNLTVLSVGSVVTPGVWKHIVLSVSPTSCVVYVNGEPVMTGSGPSLTYLCLNPLAQNINTFTVGAGRESVSPQLVQDRSQQPFCGLMSDVSLHSRALSQVDAQRLYADDYGYAVFPLAGQSNMIGTAAKVPGIDDDYTTLGGRVFQYNTFSNVEITGTVDTGTTVKGSSVIVAANPLRHPMFSVAHETGLWRTFAADLLTYGNIAWRRKLMLVPCAWGGSGFEDAWKTNGFMSNTTITATNQALSMNPMNSLAGFLWNQGENEINTRNLNYLANLQTMFALFSTSITGFSTTTTPIILGEISQLEYENTYTTGLTPNLHMISRIRADMDAVCAANPANFRLVLTRDVVCPVGSVHWDAPSLRTIGSRYFDALASIGGVDRIPTVTIPGELKGKTIDDLKAQIVAVSEANDTSGLAPKASPALSGMVGFGFAEAALANIGSALSVGTITSNWSHYLTGMVLGEVSYINNGSQRVSNPTRPAHRWYTATSATGGNTLASLSHEGALDATLSVRAPTINATTTLMVGAENVSTDFARKANPAFSGFVGINNVGATTMPYWANPTTFGAIASNLTGGNGDLSFVNSSGFTNPTEKSFTWFKYTSSTEKTMQASISHSGVFDVPGSITGPTITDLKSRVDALESSSTSTSFYRLAANETKVETNSSLKKMYFADVNGGHETLTLPTLTAGDSKFNGWVVTIRTIKDGFSTLIVNVPAGTSTFVGLAPTWDTNYYTTKTWNTTATVQYLTVGGNYYELFTQNTAAPAPYP